MSYTPLELKLHAALLGFAELTALVGTNIFNEQLPQGVLQATAPVRALLVRRVSSIRYYTHDGATNVLAAVRMQFTSYCKSVSSNADALAINNALVDFLNQFSATDLAQVPNIVLNQMVVPYSQTQPPYYSGIVDARIFNREDLT